MLHNREPLSLEMFTRAGINNLDSALHDQKVIEVLNKDHKPHSFEINKFAFLGQNSTMTASRQILQTGWRPAGIHQLITYLIESDYQVKNIPLVSLCGPEIGGIKCSVMVVREKGRVSLTLIPIQRGFLWPRETLFLKYRIIKDGD